MKTPPKNYIKLIVICLIVVGLYFVINSITSLKIYPLKINSGKRYISLVNKYGFPKILKHTKRKLINRDINIITGQDCTRNISLPPISRTKGESNVPSQKKGKKEFLKLRYKKTDTDLQENIKGINLSGFKTYIQLLEGELAMTSQNKNEMSDIDKLTRNSISLGMKTGDGKKPKENKQMKSKFYSADVYGSNLLACFKIKSKFFIVSLAEKYYKCVSPIKEQFFTYSRLNDNSVLLYPGGITESQFEKYLDFKKGHNKLSSAWNWKAMRTKDTWKKFYRLYKFTVPTATTCMLINNKIILYGNNIHKKNKLLKIIQQALGV